jgi:hypothetical protein
MIESERALFAAIEEFLAAEGCKAALRAHQLVTYATVSFQRGARVQARRDALRVVGAVKPGDGAVQS